MSTPLPSTIDEEGEQELDPHPDPCLDDPGPGARQDPRLDPRDDRTASARRSGEKGMSARQPNTWSTTRFERLSRQGAFELSRASDGTWDLRICMSDLDPPLTDEGMQVYCRWLHRGLQRVREECTLRSLRQIRAEINFSKNRLSDDAVGRLLQALQRSELSVTCLNLSGNCIGLAGAHHVCDFLRDASVPLREVHLSHNKLDDEAALEMIRLFSEHPRYPPRRPRDGRGGEVLVPVWLRLNNNRIRDPAKVLRKAESELGVTVSHSHSRHTGGPRVCSWLHLYRFDVQDAPVPGPELPEEKRLVRRRDRALGPRLEGSIAEEGPSHTLSLHQSVRSEAHARRASARSGNSTVASGGERVASASIASPMLGSSLGDANTGAAAVQSQGAASGHGLMSSRPPEPGGEHSPGAPGSDAQASPGAPPPPPGSPSAQRPSLATAARSPPPTDAVPPPAPPTPGTAEEPAQQGVASAALPAGPGAPELTPEPDGQLPGAPSVGAPQRGARGPCVLGVQVGKIHEHKKVMPAKRVTIKVQEDCIEGEVVAACSTPPSPPPRPPVRLLVAPRILQRGVPLAALPPEPS